MTAFDVSKRLLILLALTLSLTPSALAEDGSLQPAGDGMIRGVGAGLISTQSGGVTRDYVAVNAHGGGAYRRYHDSTSVLSADATIGESGGHFLGDLDLLMGLYGNATGSRDLCGIGPGFRFFGRLKVRDEALNKRSGAGFSYDVTAACGEDDWNVAASVFGEYGIVSLAGGFRALVTVPGVSLVGEKREQLRIGGKDGAYSDLSEESVQLRGRIPLGGIAGYLGLEARKEHEYARKEGENAKDTVTLGVVAGGAY